MKVVSKWKSLQGQINRNRQFYISIMAQAIQADSILFLKQIIFATVCVASSETEGKNENGEDIPCEVCKLFLKHLIGGGELETEAINAIMN